MITYEELASTFSADELMVVADCAWVDAYGRPHDGLTMTAGWVSHVAKLDSDRALPWTDHSVWTEHDLAAALFIRDFLAHALAELPSVIADRLMQVAAETDAQFLSFTIEDPGRRMDQVADVDGESRGRWWSRVPVDGPVAHFLSRY